MKTEFPLIDFDDLIATTETDYLIKGLIPRVGIAIVWGPPKCGKSFWILYAMMHVALGWRFHGRRVKQGSVVYCAFEGAAGYHNRAHAFRRKFLKRYTDHVPFYLQPARMNLPDKYDALIDSIRAQVGRPAVVVLDTLNKSLAGSESGDEDMASYIAAADAIREAFDCAVIVVHHCGHNETRPRGHSSLTAAADAQLAIWKDEKQRCSVV